MKNSSDNEIRREKTTPSDNINCIGRQLDLVSIREALEKVMSQEEFALLARGEARRLGLRRARKISRSGVSLFLSGSLPRGHVYAAILSAAQKFLDVEVFSSDDDHDA